MNTNKRTTIGVRIFGRILGWISALGVLFMVLTGYGITQARLFDTWTSGLWSKVLSQIAHENVGIPLVIILCVHIGIALWWRGRGESSASR